MMRFSAYDWAKGVVHTGWSFQTYTSSSLQVARLVDIDSLCFTEPGPIPAYKMALAGSMAGGIAGIIGNPAELMMVRMQADKAKPPDRGFYPIPILLLVVSPL